MKTHSRSESIGNIPENNYEEIEQPIGNKNVKTKKKKITLIKQYLIDYTANSNLHGLKYIGEKERTLVEKIFWLFMFVSCVILCSGLIRKIWIKWNKSPVIVSFAESPTPVWQIPYPAVTVCFETKSQQTKFNYTKYFHLYNYETTRANLTSEECEIFEDISLICDFSDYISARFGTNISGRDKTVQNLIKVSPKINEMFAMCRWKDKSYRQCSRLFRPILTEEGPCYTFNTMGAEEIFRVENLHSNYSYVKNSKKRQSWTLENGYPPNTPLKTYPRRGNAFGARAGLIFELVASQEDLDYVCSFTQGYKVQLHNPAEMPRLSHQFFRSSLSQNVIVAVKPKMMTTSEGLKHYDSTRRQCYFPSESYLHYFKVYTQANCEMECLTNYTYKYCRCVHFSMPHGPEIPVCNARQLSCMRLAQRTVLRARRVAANCKCLPACTSIEYEAEISQADYNFQAHYRALTGEILNQSSEIFTTRFTIFFKEAQFIASRRSELYGQIDFLANCGGLLGLFMGFSILSVAEILYFLTLRLYCVLWKRRQAKKPAHLNENAILGPQDEKLKDLHIY